MKNLFWKLVYEIKYAALGLKRHFWLSFSSLTASAVTLLLIGILIVSGFHTNLFSQQVESNLGIHVVLEKDIENKFEIEEIKEEISKISGIETIEFSDKEEELEKMIQEKGEAFSMYRGEENPLSHAFLVYTKDGHDLEKIASQIEKISGIDGVAYGGESTLNFVDVLYKLRKMGYIALVLLVILSLYLIYNTIRTMISSRSDEIIIMRQVGASNAFVKRPFELEGIFLGCIGALIPFAILMFGYSQIYAMLGGRFFASTFTMISVKDMAIYLGGILVLCGIGIGWLASVIATSKFIKEKR